MTRPGSERGQASILIVGGLAGILVAALIVAAVAQAVAREAGAQRSADLAALAGARIMHDNYTRLFEPPRLDDGTPNPRHLDKDDYLVLGRSAAIAVARGNGAHQAAVSFPDADTMAPVRIHLKVRERLGFGHGKARRTVTIEAEAEAELGPSAGFGETIASGGGYDGPLAHRQGIPMRPDVALAFDRMNAAAQADGVSLAINSGFRSDAEQAVLFARHPDPRWVARPGTSLHRNGTELDLGPPGAYGWLAANARRFHFVQRYPWEAWHYGYVLNPQSRPRAATSREDAGDSDGEAGAAHGSVPGFVPARYAPIIARAAQRWNVAGALLAAQLYQESGFNPFAVSKAGAQGIAQFMPATARGMGLANPFDPEAAIDAQAHMMRDLLRQFGSVALALAAYNAGPAPVSACGCVPNFPETRGYVARILGLMSGAGVPLGGGSGLAVRLVA